MYTKNLSPKYLKKQINDSIIELYDYKNNNNKKMFWKTFLPLIFKLLILFIINDEVTNKTTVEYIFEQFTYFYKDKSVHIKDHVIQEINNTNNYYKNILNNKIGGNFNLIKTKDELNLILKYNKVRHVNNPINIKISLINFLNLLNNS